MLRNHSGEAITERAVEAYSQIEDPRLREIVAALIRHLHALVKEVGLGEQEWEFAWDFMARMARFTGPERVSPAGRRHGDQPAYRGDRPRPACFGGRLCAGWSILSGECAGAR
jgi:hypothetical protein